MCSRARVLMQSSYEDTVENGAREEKKRYSRVQPKKKEKRKYLRHLVHFFLFFRGKKGKTHPFLDRSRDASFFSLLLRCLGFVVCGGKKSTRPRMKRREREEDEKENFTRHHRRQSQSRDSLESNTISIRSIR